jgi:leucyl-tRNA synthetase
MPYDHQAIEARWQAYWDEKQTFKAEIDLERPKYYVLDMFPYPSGNGLHVGHPEGYTATDIVARYKRMRGFNVLHPMGWDAFGLPAEQYAIKQGVHPAIRTAECVETFKRQLKSLGFSYDWSREINTTDPKYFKWTQWIFLQLWDAWFDEEAQKARPIAELSIPADVEAAGEAAVADYKDDRRLAYLSNAPVNWCVEEKVVLANEEVAEYVDKGLTVVRKPLEQWKFRITAYTERLLEDLNSVDWPSSVIAMQREWIGRSEGAEVDFQVEGVDGEAGRLRVFTTRPDTLFGATYMVLAPEHPLVEQIVSEEQAEAAREYVRAAALKSERNRQIDGAKGEKTGVFTGAHAINPANGKSVPIWVADYVLMGYGTGAIMSVPGHDERDHAFAKAMGLPIVEVVSGGGDIQAEAFSGHGVAVNSGHLDGKPTPEAKSAMIEWLEAQGKGEGRTTYKLRDWLFSRQRYWGEPFPLVKDDSGRVHRVDDSELPVQLPAVENFGPSESGDSPLVSAADWRKHPVGSRETNTMPQWAGSCWYYLRFADPGNDGAPWSEAAERYWLPVDLYIGGAEHAVLHLLYARFWHKALFDLGHVSTKEPFQRLVNQGMVLGATYYPKDKRRNEDGSKLFFTPDQVEPVEAGSDEYVTIEGREPVVAQWEKMSKSRGNVVNPDDVINAYGADTMRLYEMFMGPLEQSAPWQAEGVTGCYRFLNRAHRLFFDEVDDREVAREFEAGEGNERQRRLLHKTIDEVSDRIDRMSFNTAISSLMVFARDIEKGGERIARDSAAQFALLLAPFAPHMAEHMWQALGKTQTLSYEPWPAADPSLLVADTWTLVLQVNGKKRAELSISASIEPKAAKDHVEGLALEHESIKRALEQKGVTDPRRVIYVPGKLVNVVI